MMRREKLFLIVLLFCSLPFVGLSQTEIDTLSLSDTFLDSSQKTEIDQVVVHSDSILSSMVDWHISMYNQNQTTKGYRVQIYFGSGQGARENAQNIKKSFLERFPDTKAYIIYNAPDFKVRVGDYRSKSEALRLKKSLEHIYRDAFIVPDQISFPDL